MAPYNAQRVLKQVMCLIKAPLPQRYGGFSSLKRLNGYQSGRSIKQVASVVFLNVCSQNWEVSQFIQLDQSLITIVEVMVSGSHSGIADLIHDTDYAFSPCQGRESLPVERISGIENQSIRIFTPDLLYDRGNFGKSDAVALLDPGVGIIGMYDRQPCS